MRCGTLAAAAAAVLSFTAVAHADAIFRPLGTLWTDQSSFVYGLSPDGTMPVGRGMDFLVGGGTAGRAVRWPFSGIERIADGLGYFDVSAEGVSSGGSVIVGYGQLGSNLRAFRHTAGGSSLLPHLPGQATSVAFDTTPDGSTIVGRSGPTPCRWIAGGDPIPLDLPVGATSGAAYSVSADGIRIAGTASIAGVVTPFIWTQGVGAQALDLGEFAFNSTARVSLDGSTVVGASMSPTGQRLAYRWTLSEGVTPLPSLPGSGSDLVQARECNGDGTVVVGSSRSRAVVWVNGQPIDLNTHLPSLGIDLTGWTLSSAAVISADGLTIGGTGSHLGRTEAWIVTIPAPGTAITSLALLGVLVRRRR